MASIRSKRRHSDTKEDPAVAKNHSSNEHNTDNVGPGGEIFLPYLDHETGKVIKYVDFNARLGLVKAASEEVEQDQYVFQDVDPKGLAYSAGFRDGDILREVNGDNIEGSGIFHVLGLLLNYEEPEIFLGVKRDGQPQPYIWVIFEIVEKDGVHVNQRLENDTDELPLISLIAAKKCFKFDGKSEHKYEIYVEEEKSLSYLAIENGELVFQTSYNPQTSSFYQYNYAGINRPGRGQVVVYSLKNIEPYKPPTPQTTPASEDKLELMDMPDQMVVEWKKLIPTTNPRFWYQKKTTGPEGSMCTSAGDASVGNYFTLQSVNATSNMYLGIGEIKGPGVRTAVLTGTKTVLTIVQSD